MVDIIKKKKIKKWLLNLLLYISFCFAGWYAARSAVASLLSGNASYGFFNNDFFAFFSAGVVPVIIYLLAVRFLVYALKRTPYLPVDEMAYALPFFYIGANIVTGLVSIVYIFVPLASFWCGIIVPIIATAGFFALYLLFICRNYVKDYNWKVIVMYFGRLYIVITLIFTAFGLISAVLV